MNLSYIFLWITVHFNFYLISYLLAYTSITIVVDLMTIVVFTFTYCFHLFMSCAVQISYQNVAKKKKRIPWIIPPSVLSGEKLEKKIITLKIHWWCESHVLNRYTFLNWIFWFSWTLWAQLSSQSIEDYSNALCCKYSKQQFNKSICNVTTSNCVVSLLLLMVDNAI